MAAVKPIVAEIQVQPAPLPEVMPQEIPASRRRAQKRHQLSWKRFPKSRSKITFLATVKPAESNAGPARSYRQIRRENAAKQDGFLLAQMDRRKELRGLQFIMKDDCKLGVADGKSLANSVREVRREIDRQNGRQAPRHIKAPADDIARMRLLVDRGSNLAALSQILAAEDKTWRGRLCG